MKRTVILALVCVLVAGVASAYGGGGFFQGSYVFVPEYSSIDRAVEIVGGYGYGADRHGSRHGGFGLAIHDESTGDLLGGFGGVISGSQARTGPVTLSLNLWGGIGYVSPALVRPSHGPGFLLELDAEAGFALLPWLQLSVYGGMQALGSLDLAALVSSVRYTPVVGSRLTWGGF